MSEKAGRINEVWFKEASKMDEDGAKINGVDNSTFNKLCDILEITQFGNEYKKRMAGLKDSSISLSGNYDPDDAGQTALEPGDFVWVGVYPEGPDSTGTQAEFIVENFEQTATADGKQEFSCSLQGNSEPENMPAQT